MSVNPRAMMTLLGALALAAAAGPAAAHDHSSAMQPAGTVLQLSATHEINSAPDIATLSAGVVTDAPTAKQAMADNAREMNRVFEALKRAGVKSKDMQTSGLNLSARYDYKRDQPPRLIGYQAQNMLMIRLRDLGAVGATLDALVDAGVNQVNGPDFGLDNPESAQDEARVAAMKKARARAELYAAAAGLKVGRILTISENAGYAPSPMPKMMARAAMDMAESAPTPVAPGEVSINATVNVTFELVNGQ